MDTSNLQQRYDEIVIKVADWQNFSLEGGYRGGHPKVDRLGNPRVTTLQGTEPHAFMYKALSGGNETILHHNSSFEAQELEVVGLTDLILGYAIQGQLGNLSLGSVLEEADFVEPKRIIYKFLDIVTSPIKTHYPKLLLPLKVMLVDTGAGASGVIEAIQEGIMAEKFTNAEDMNAAFTGMVKYYREAEKAHFNIVRCAGMLTAISIYREVNSAAETLGIPIERRSKYRHELDFSMQGIIHDYFNNLE